MVVGGAFSKVISAVGLFSNPRPRLVPRLVPLVLLELALLALRGRGELLLEQVDELGCLELLAFAIPPAEPLLDGTLAAFLGGARGRADADLGFVAGVVAGDLLQRRDSSGLCLCRGF